MSDNSSASAIEVNGVNPVPDSERYGTPAGLFPIWFSWNISIFGITLGIYVLGLGLSVWQAMLAGVIGYFVSCALVGILAVGSVRTGLPTLVQSRFAFGYHGNKIPTFFGYVANMGWKVTMLSMASTTLADLMCHLVPVLAQVDGSPTSACVFGSFIVVIVLTMTGAVWGYQLIMKIEKAIAWITGLFTLVYLFFFIPQIDFSVLGDRPSAGIVEFLGAVVLSMTMVGLGFLNYGGDYSRYLPRNTRAGGVIFWTMTGIALPVSVLLILGVMLSAGNPRASRQGLPRTDRRAHRHPSLLVLRTVLNRHHREPHLGRHDGRLQLGPRAPRHGRAALPRRNHRRQRRDHHARRLLSSLHFGLLRLDLPVVPRSDLRDHGLLGRH